MSKGKICAMIAFIACAIMYYGFHVQEFGTILKLMIAGVILIAILSGIAVGVVIYKAVKAKEEREKDFQDKKIRNVLEKYGKEDTRT